MAQEVEADTCVSISYMNVKSMFNNENIKTVMPIKNLSCYKNIKKRMKLSEEFLLMPNDYIQRIIWSDEKFNLQESDGKVKVCRKPGASSESG
jgi:hypothetical protein